MAAYKITAELNLEKIIAESREVAQVLNEFADNLEQIESKYADPQESDRKCHTCKHYTSGEHDGSCGSYICEHYSNWESEDKE